MTGQEPLDAALVRFVDVVMTADLSAARRAFADAQAHDLAAVRVPAHLWVLAERAAAARLPDVGPARGQALLAQARAAKRLPSSSPCREVTA